MNFSTPVAHIVFCLPFIANVLTIQSSQKNIFFFIFLVYLKKIPRLLNVYQESKKGMDGYIYVALKNAMVKNLTFKF